jgi:hypothetical protein
MVINLLLGFLTMMLCLLLQSVLLAAAMRYYLGHERLLNSPSMATSLLVINVVMFLLVLGNLGQVAVWAMLFRVLGEFQTFPEAYYHSAVNFATLGYGDIVMSDKRRLLGPLEAINGVLMIGVSTAALMAAFQDAMKRMLRARHPS